jgi:ABC-type multidrug transport system permease subunit
VLPQVRVLAHRYVRLLARDRRNLALLLGQVPVLALAMVGLFNSGLFRRPGGEPSNGLQLLFLLVTTVIWLGSIDASRELIKEKSLFLREAAVGTRLSSYLISKAVVLFGLAAIQTLALAAIVFAFQPLHEPAGTYLAVAAILVLTALVAVGMGLTVSALVESQDQATSFIPLVLIPQLLFAGSIVSVKSMGEPVQTLSNIVFSRWSFAGTGSAVDLNGRIAQDPSFARFNKYGTDFFTLSTGTTCLILAGFLVAFFAAVAVLLRRRLRR